MNKAVAFLTLPALLLGLGWRPLPLQAQENGSTTVPVTGAVVDAANRPVRNADVRLVGKASLAVTTGDDGRFVMLEVPIGTYRLTVRSARLGEVTRDDVAVGAAIDVQIRFEAKTAGLREIGRVSTSARGTINITPAAVTTISTQQFAAQGETQWRRILEETPGVSLGDFGSAPYHEANSPLNIQGVSIGGALPYESAITVDGMPFQTAGLLYDHRGGTGVDLAAIPIDAFRAADIVRGPGAQAPSIIGAIGGSLNLLTPFAASRSAFNASIANDPYGGTSINASAAVRLAKLSLSGTFLDATSPGPINGRVMGTLISPSPYRVATIDGQPAGCTGTCAPTLLQSGVTATSAVTCCFPVSSGSTQHAYSVALNYAVSSAIAAKLFYTHLEAHEALLPSETIIDFTPAAGYAGSFPAGTNRIVQAFGNSNQIEENSMLVGRLTAAIGQHGFASAQFLNNRNLATFANIVPPGPYTAQLWGTVDVNGIPTIFNGESHSVGYKYYSNVGSDIALSHAYSLAYRQRLGDQAHADVSFTRSGYSNPQFFETGSFGPGQTNDGDANTETSDEIRVGIGGAFARNMRADAALYLTQNRYHVQDPAVPQFAGYVDREFSSAVPRIGAVWRPIDALSVRSAIGGAIALPPIDSLVDGQGPPSPNNQAAPTYYTVSVNNVGIHPETSFGTSIGADLRIANVSIVSLDLYQTNVFGQFFTNYQAAGSYQGLPLYQTSQRNIGRSRYEGVLLGLHHEPLAGLQYTFSGGLTRGYVLSVPEGFYDTPAGPKTTNLTIVPGVNFNAFNTGVPVPYSQAYGTAGYRWRDGADAILGATYYGANNGYYHPAFVVFNLNGDVPLARHVSLHLSAQNLTNMYGDSLPVGGPGNFLDIPTVEGAPVAQGLEGIPYGPRTLKATLRLAF